MTLNEAQEKAVQTTDGPVLIVAGAGAGKTRVITHRILNLIKKGVAPHEILAITFTNKAAKEMRDRVLDLIANDKELNIPISFQERPFVSTFHSLGVHILRENAKILNLGRNFSISDRGDSKKAVKEAMIQASVDPKQFDPGVILNKISRLKGESVTAVEFRDMTKNYMDEVVAEVWDRYEHILERDKTLDFDDLLLKTARLLADKPEVRKHYSSVWKYVHIDEYQDTNHVQYKIAKLLADENKNICVVGDADQNIYSWRGATIENILNFEKDYPNATVIVLEKNYRSTKTILSAANSVIEKNTMRKKKNLYTDNDDGDKISLIVSYSDQDEARTVAEEARALIEKGTSPKEIAVLYRTNFQSRLLEEYFIKKNIPHQLVGIRFFERKEVKDVLSYVKASLNRESWNDVGRVINVPTRGIGKATVAKIMSKEEGLIAPGTRKKVEDFWKLLGDIKKEIVEKKPSDALRFVIKETGIEGMYMRGDEEDEEKLLNIRELVSVATQYDHLKDPSTEKSEEDRLKSIQAFLDSASLATDQDDLEVEKDAVRLMTVHASKGLEFGHVFIAGMEQDLFPLKHLEEAEISQAEDEEERRLFYVALTRAKKKVYLSYAIMRTIYGSQRVNAPSEFIEDIEKGLIENAPPEKPSGAKAIFIDF